MGNYTSRRRKRGSSSVSRARSAPCTPSGGLKDLSRIHSDFFRSISHEFARNSLASGFTSTNTPPTPKTRELQTQLVGDLDDNSGTKRDSCRKRPIAKRKQTPGANTVTRTGTNFRLSRAQTVMIRKSWDLSTRMGACEPGLSILYGLMDRDRGVRAIYENACYEDRQNPLKLDSFLCAYAMKLTKVLQHVIDELNQLSMVESLLRVLGKRHAQFTTIPLRPRQWEIFAEVMVEVVLKCGVRSNPVTRDGWCRLSLFIVSTMQDAYDTEYKRRHQEMVTEVARFAQRQQDKHEKQRKQEQLVNQRSLQTQQLEQVQLRRERLQYQPHGQDPIDAYHGQNYSPMHDNSPFYPRRSVVADNPDYTMSKSRAGYLPGFQPIAGTNQSRCYLERQPRRQSYHLGPMDKKSTSAIPDAGEFNVITEQLLTNRNQSSSPSDWKVRSTKLDRNRNKYSCVPRRPNSSYGLSCMFFQPQRHGHSGSGTVRKDSYDFDFRRNSVLFLGSAVPKLLTSPDLRNLSYRSGQVSNHRRHSVAILDEEKVGGTTNENAQN